jgi:hypothetical protein
LKFVPEGCRKWLRAAALALTKVNSAAAAIVPQASAYPADRALVGAVEQSAGDDLGLDLGGAFENVENARIA